MVHLFKYLYNRSVCQKITGAEAGHGIGLGKALHHDELCFQILTGSQRPVSTKSQLAVYLIADDKHRFVFEKFMETGKGLLRIDCAGRVVG